MQVPNTMIPSCWPYAKLPRDAVLAACFGLQVACPAFAEGTTNVSGTSTVTATLPADRYNYSDVEGSDR